MSEIGPSILQANRFHGRGVYREVSPAAFRRSLTTLTVSRASTYVAADLTPGEIRSVHVRVGQTAAHGFQSRIEVTWGDALGPRPSDICCSDGPSDSS
jgi:hypothetical protein